MTTTQTEVFAHEVREGDLYNNERVTQIRVARRVVYVWTTRRVYDIGRFEPLYVTR